MSSSFGLAAATQHGTSGSSSSRSNRNSTILPSSGSDAYPSMYKRIGSSENISQHNNDNMSNSRTSSTSTTTAATTSIASSSSSSSAAATITNHQQTGHNHHHHQQQQQHQHHSSHRSSSQTQSQPSQSQIVNTMRMSSSLTMQHDPNITNISNQLAKTSATSMASSHPSISLKNNSSSPASSSGSSTQYYQHMINNHAQNGSDLIAIKCKFEAEFRRFSLHRSDIKSLEEFQKTIEHFHKLFKIPFSLFYIDPVHGDLLPISNDINFKLAISSAKPLLRLVVQRKGNQVGSYSLGTKKTNFLGTLLPSSGSSASNKLARLQISAPEDFRQVSSIIDVDIVPETCRRVRLVKHGSDKPLGFYIRDGTSVRVTAHGVEKVPGIFISRLIPGGLAESTGLLAVNDEVLEVNGIEVSGKSLDQVTDMMVANSSNLIITIRPANQRGHGTSYSTNTLGSQHSNFTTGSLERDYRPKKLSTSSGMDYHNPHYHNHGSGRRQNFYPEDAIRRNASHRHSANIIQSSVPQHQQYSSTNSRIHSRQHPNMNSSQALLNRHSVHIGAIDDSVIISGHQRPSVDDDSDDDEDEIHDHFATSSVRHNGHYGATTVTINSMPPPTTTASMHQQQEQLTRTPSNHSISNNSQQAAAAAGTFVRNSLRGKNRPESGGVPSGYDNVTYGSRTPSQQLQQQQQQQQQQSQQYNHPTDKTNYGLYLTPASSTSSSPIAKTKLTSTSILVNQTNSNSNSSRQSSRKPSDPNENDIVTL